MIQWMKRERRRLDTARRLEDLEHKALADAIGDFALAVLAGAILLFLVVWGSLQ